MGEKIQSTLTVEIESPVFRLRWTDKKPTKAGWYWFSGDFGVPSTGEEYGFIKGDYRIQWPVGIRIWNVVAGDGGLYIFFHRRDSFIEVSKCHGVWAGPIQEPLKMERRS